jgi:hypothetical protein
MNILHPLPLVASIFAGCISAYFAYKQNKNVYLWFVLGFLLGVFGVMFLFFISKQKKKVSQKPEKVQPTPSIEGPKDKFWYYLDSIHNQKGPISLDALTTQWKAGEIKDSTYVWNEEMSDWTPLNHLIVIR